MHEKKDKEGEDGKKTRRKIRGRVQKRTVREGEGDG